MDLEPGLPTMGGDAGPRPPFLDVQWGLSLGLVQVTEAAALQAARLLGRGDADRVKSVAGAAMLNTLEDLGFTGRVALAPRGDRLLSHGSRLGIGSGPVLDLGVYPVEGATRVARGLPDAVSVAVAAEADSFPDLPAVWYMEKIVVGPGARGAVELDDSLTDNLRRVAFARDARVPDLTVAVLDRPRHREIVEEVRASGARLLLLEEGEIGASALAAAPGTGVDVAVGIGGLQETLIAAAVVRCLGGEIQGRLWPRSDEERVLAGNHLGRRYRTDELAPSQVAAAITGISGGPLLGGAWFGSTFAETHSMTMSTRRANVRRITTRHHRVGESQ